MTLTDLSPPPALAVSLEAVKAFLRVDHPDEDALLAGRSGEYSVFFL